MAHVSGLLRPDDRVKIARRAGLIAGAIWLVVASSAIAQVGPPLTGEARARAEAAFAAADAVGAECVARDALPREVVAAIERDMAERGLDPRGPFPCVRDGTALESVSRAPGAGAECTDNGDGTSTCVDYIRDVSVSPGSARSEVTATVDGYPTVASIVAEAGRFRRRATPVAVYASALAAAMADGTDHDAVVSIARLDFAAEGDALEIERQHMGPLSGTHGVPILLKDNIETFDLPTTAGSLALIGNAPGRDAPLVTRLREAGAVILGKTNLSEWANIRSSESISGWSAVGGQTRNPYDAERTPCGSSAGSAVAVAIGLAPAAIGTETDGSITCPASVNGVVGFKPTVGLVSRTHIVPISHSQDTAGPITTTVEDAAMVLSVMAGSDPMDPATAEADARKVDFRAALDANSLNGARIGVLRFLVPNYSAETQAVFEANLQVMRDAGAVLVEITGPPADFRQIGGWELTVLLTELKHDLNLYLASTDPEQVRTRTLAELIAFNAAEPRETALFGQDLFERAEATDGLDDPAYVEARDRSLRAAGPEGIDRMMAEHGVVALTAPTTSRAWTNDPDDDDRSQGSASRLAAVAGYPHLTVPMGFDRGMPVGISFIGGKWDDAKVLSLGYAFEQRTHARRAPGL